MRIVWLIFLLLAACKAPPRETQPVEEPPPVAEPPPLPEGFLVQGTPSVDPPSLPPEAMWRFLVSRLTALRADARAEESDLLVTFESDAAHLTDRRGRRHTWRLPPGLQLDGGPRHVVLGADLSARVYGADGTQVPAAEEINVISARVTGKGGDVAGFRLVIKGGRTFRSISNSG